MHRSTLFLFFAFITAAFAAFQPQQCGKAPKKADVAAIKKQFKGDAQAKQFCNWFLSEKRTLSPVNKAPFPKEANKPASIKRFSNACECISKKKQATKAQAVIKNPGAKAKCNENQKKTLVARVPQPAVFCKVWRTAAWRPSSAAPFGKALNVRQIYNACECVSPTKKPATSSKKPTKSSSTSSKKPGKKSSSTVLVSSAAATTVAPVTTGAAVTSAVTSAAPVSSSSSVAPTTSSVSTASTSTTLDLIQQTTTSAVPTTTATTSATTTDTTTATTTATTSATTTETTTATTTATTSATTTATTTVTTTATTTATTTVTTTAAPTTTTAVTTTTSHTTDHTTTSAEASSTGSGSMRRMRLRVRGRQYTEENVMLV
ncbi:Hypothetical protein D9617_27g044660 [Elsinoe fawcettii]|nr:Hypothetical protein D9617_27g044660 [Elsinoe fawcettii]